MVPSAGVEMSFASGDGQIPILEAGEGERKKEGLCFISLLVLIPVLRGKM